MLNLTATDALHLVQQHWQISGDISELPSYADRNFKISSSDGTYVFKIANPNWSYADLDIENAALLHLEKTCPDLALPKVLLSQQGLHIIPLSLASLDSATAAESQTQLCHMRLLTFVEGEVYAKVAQDPEVNLNELETSLGVAIGKLDRGLQDFEHPAMNRYVDWSISNLPTLTSEIEHIEDLHLRQLVAHHTHYFALHEAEWKSQLPMAVIHNDANDFNVIVAREAPAASSTSTNKVEVNAIIDFGDMCRHLRVVDLAITIVYALQHAEETKRIQECMLAILRGYQAVHPLTQAELLVLPALIVARLSQSVLMATRAYRKNPENTYIMISQVGVRRLLKQFDSMGQATLQALVLSVLSAP